MVSTLVEFFCRCPVIEGPVGTRKAPVPPKELKLALVGRLKDDDDAVIISAITVPDDVAVAATPRCSVTAV